MKQKRREMGEEAWAEYQKQRKINKAQTWKNRNVKKVVEWRRRTKVALVAYKGGKCERCGYDKSYLSCYVFHHRDPNEKEFGIGAGGRTRSLEQLKKEVDKCDLLCCRCHAEVHEELYNKMIAVSSNG